MDSMNVDPMQGSGLGAFQIPGMTAGMPGLAGAGMSPTAAASRCLGLVGMPELTDPASQLAAAQAFTAALLKMIMQLLYGKHQGGAAGFPPMATAPMNGGGSPAAYSGGGGGSAAAGSSSSARSGGSATSGGTVGGNQGAVKAGANGKVDPKALQAYLEQRIARSKLNGFKPSDGSRYGVDGSAASWAAFMTKLVEPESGYDTNAVGDVGVFRGGSRGLYQLSYDDATSYNLNGGKPFTAEQLADPAFNADVAVSIMEYHVLKAGSISGGAGQYWAPIKNGWTG